MHRRLPLAAMLAAFALATGCDDGERAADPIDRFVVALPGADLLALDVPGEEIATTDAPLDVIEAPLLGRPSELRDLTGSVRRFLQQLVDQLTDGVERLTEGRPAVHTADRALWRHVIGAEERALAVRKSDGHYDFSVWTRPAGTRERWRFLIFGRLVAGADGATRGAMWIDLDHDLRPRSHGKMSLLWAITDETRELELTVFDGTPDEDAVGRITRNFRYSDGPEGGILAFDAGERDVHIAPDHAGKERVRVMTRWSATRKLRSDYAAVGPEVRGDGFRVLLGSECWVPPDPDVTFETRLGLPVGGGEAQRLFERGDRSTCAFPDEEPPVVPAPGAAPSEPTLPEDLVPLQDVR